MNNRRRVAFLVLSILVFLPAARGAEPATKEARVRELLVVMRAGDMGVQMVDGMIGAMKEAMPAAPAEFWTSFRNRVKPDELVDMLVPIYANNLEPADVEELIRFYGSPAGQRFLDRQPAIMQQSMVVGQKWGERLATEALAELQKKKAE